MSPRGRMMLSVLVGSRPDYRSVRLPVDLTLLPRRSLLLFPGTPFTSFDVLVVLGAGDGSRDLVLRAGNYCRRLLIIIQFSTRPVCTGFPRGSSDRYTPSCFISLHRLSHRFIGIVGPPMCCCRALLDTSCHLHGSRAIIHRLALGSLI